jgi:hypothetical protein
MTQDVKATSRARRPAGSSDLSAEVAGDVSAALAGLLADVFALYVKIKNFHCHMSGPHCDAAVHRADRPNTSHRRQRRGICRSPGGAREAAREQASAHLRDASGPQYLRGIWRDRQPAPNLDRRDQAAHLVPQRNRPYRAEVQQLIGRSCGPLAASAIPHVQR